MYSYKGYFEVLCYVAFWFGSLARKQTHAPLFSKNIYNYFSKFIYALMVAFPLEVRHNYYCVSTSQRPNFSDRTEPRLRCCCLGCEYGGGEKKRYSSFLSKKPKV